MALLDIPVPQMREGLQEVIIVEFQKKPGDAIKRDDILYSNVAAGCDQGLPMLTIPVQLCRESGLLALLGFSL